MSRRLRSDVVVWYKAPGGDRWRVIGEERRALLRRARELLAKMDEEIRQAESRRLQRVGEHLELEREMAAALGAWERWVSAGAREIFARGREAVETAGRGARGVFRKVLKLREDD